MIWVAPRVAGQHLKMEVDTGSAYSVIPLSVYKEMIQKQELQPTSVTLQTYMGASSPSWQTARQGAVQTTEGETGSVRH